MVVNRPGCRCTSGPIVVVSLGSFPFGGAVDLVAVLFSAAVERRAAPAEVVAAAEAGSG